MSTEPTVFVVDHDTRGRRSLERRLGAMGLRTRGFASAERLLAAEFGSAAGCLLTELFLPRMSGLELLARIRSAEIHLPVLIMTACSDVSSVVAAMKAGAVDVIQKPCTDSALWDAVQTALELDAQRRHEASVRADIHARLATLTAEEKATLELLMAGKPNKCIARDLDVSQRTINFRRAALMKKMNTRSLVELARLLALADAAPPANGQARLNGRLEAVSG